MPAYTESTPTITRKFSDITFTVPAPFAEAAVLTANEASFLNGQIASVVGNGFSGAIRRALKTHNDEAKKAFVAAGNKAKDYVEVTDATVLNWDFQAKFNEAYTDYELGVSNRGGGDGASTSGNAALDRMIDSLNAEDLKARIAAKGLKVSTFYKAPATAGTDFKSKWAELLAGNLTAKGDAFKATAEAVLANLAATDTATDSLLDGLTDAEPTPEPVAAE